MQGVFVAMYAFFARSEENLAFSTPRTRYSIAIRQYCRLPAEKRNDIERGNSHFFVTIPTLQNNSKVGIPTLFPGNVKPCP